MDNNTEAFEIDTAVEPEQETQLGMSVTDSSDTEITAPETKKQKDSTLLGVFDWVDSVVASVVLVVLVFTFFFRIVGIVGDSMNNTLDNGDRVIIHDLFYKAQRGDVIVISRNASNDKSTADDGNGPIIKRVIATAGESVDIRYEDGVGYVYVNSVLLNEPYIKEYIKESFITENPISFPVIVPDGCVFVMGDNRNDSLDSRSGNIGSFGMVDERYIIGHAVARVYPFNKIGAL